MKDVKHSSRKHALLSASGAARWINCPPSARMEEALGIVDTSSVYAEEGTLAHELADIELRLQTYVGKVGKGSPKQKLIDQKELLKKNELYQSEMDEFVKVYTDYVLQEFLSAKKKTPDAVLKIEEKTDFSYLVPEGFGTSDANIIADGVLEITDLKYGKGVRVEAKANSQLRLYALGLLRKFDLVYDIHTVKMSIVQPRLYHIDSEILSVAELHNWASEVVEPAANLAYKGGGYCAAGSWCRWCKAKATCRTIAKHNLELAKSEFADPKTLTDSEMLKVFEQSNMLVDWANAVSGHLLKEALDGKKFEGYKLVQGRSNRKWADEKEAIKKLSKDFELCNITNTKIKGIGEIEKLVGKSVFGGLNLTIKPPGKPTFVPESDKRPAFGVEQAKKDFE